MVVLDEDGVVEAEAVIAAAAGLDRVLLEGSQARSRLAGADDAGAVGRDQGDQVAGGGGDAAELAEEVEGGALGGEKRPRRPAHDR